MDTGEGFFKQITEEQKQVIEKAYERIDAYDVSRREDRGKRLSIFEVGEEVSIKNSNFRVQSIGDSCLVLKLLPKKA